MGYNSVLFWPRGPEIRSGEDLRRPDAHAGAALQIVLHPPS
jgi:hypothetical protein